MRFSLRQRCRRNRLVALVDPTEQEGERDLVTFAEPRDDPSGFVHPVSHLRYEFLRAREEQRPRQLDPDRDVGTFTAEEDEDLLADLDHMAARSWFIRPSLEMVQRVSAKLVASATRGGHSGFGEATICVPELFDPS